MVEKAHLVVFENLTGVPAVFLVPIFCWLVDFACKPSEPAILSCPFAGLCIGAILLGIRCHWLARKPRFHEKPLARVVFPMVASPTTAYVGEGFASVECYVKFTTGFILSLGSKSICQVFI